MAIINTNINALTGLSNLRKTNLGIQNSLEKLSSGYRINKAADDPSGLAISVGMKAQIRGLDMAIQNAEDNINLIQTADGALEESKQIMLRMRDIAVRGANQAQLNTFDQRKLYREFISLGAEMVRKGDAVTFNGKNLLNNLNFDPDALFGTRGQVAQIGADNAAASLVNVEIPSLTFYMADFNGNPLALNSFANTLTDYSPQDGAGMLFESPPLPANQAPPDITDGFQGLIDWSNEIIDRIGQIRSSLGVRQKRLVNIVNDLTVQKINISASRSRITDANMAMEITDFTKKQILQQSGTAILAQANAQPQSVLQLLQ